jgi:4-hydroxy-4-methyl-2-oxoglutarate aldolase
MTNITLSPYTLARLRAFDTPTVCNVIELYNIRPKNEGFMDSRIRACFPDLPPMIGFAMTATFRASAPAPSDAYSSLEDQIDMFAGLPAPPVIVFEDLDVPSAAATFGEIMCTTYQAFGAEGLITSGAGRDLEQVRKLNFPVFTNGAICSHGYCHIPTTQVPVTVGGLMVNPGDLLHGDCNGVTTIPYEIASEVGDACERFLQAEAVILEYLASERLTPEGLREATGECHRMIDALKSDIASKRNA